ncbi:phospholipid-transporting ATPase FetA isoform X7 [Mus musculus]|uniref:phospholipid-transporting ATPase FetA isoform X7 n=1 Tax=Mus musculus TaxID=10090 RepID=UPI0003D731BD|nr:phospholipid-transporting ATPase FetA isoform X7 [Mus musculus]|eukprot:XP_006538064.1 PREDICTED: phospholipid-transporting ATPase FetA isoform X7 [Mus musculus]
MKYVKAFVSEISWDCSWYCSAMQERRNEDRQKEEEERILQANNRRFNSLFEYPDNSIKTSKYGFFNFLPMNLFEQFQRLANAYFLILLFLQLVPQISSLAWYTTVIPLIVVLSITGVKDAIDDVVKWLPGLPSLDLKRHRSDQQINNRSVSILVNGRVEEIKWRNVQVGDIIKLENNHPVTADMLLLSSSEPYGLTYIETADLDGETNLKVKQAISVTSAMEDNLELLSSFNGEVRCDPPNNKLDKFSGTLSYLGNTYLLNHERLLLRGCVIRNTDWCYGLVVYTGQDTKLMQNSGRSTFKRTHIDHLMNVLVVWIFMFLGGMCFLLSIGHGIWENSRGYYFQAFLPWKHYITSSATSSALIFWSYFIVLNTMVPISLYVSVEIIRLGNSYYINWDRKMFYAPKNMPAQARTTTLNEELGQVQYVFSDKTGTLTENVMIFNKCSINGKTYGYSYDDNGEYVPKSPKDKVDFSYNHLADPKFSFYDKTLVEAVKSEDPLVYLFFLCLSLCHTVMSEEKVEGELVYQAQSPDEGALVTATRNFGFVFCSRTPETITVIEMGKIRVYRLLAILDFSNERKRMSVIVRTPEDRVMLFCKGADTIIYELLHPSCASLSEVTMDHLDDFASEGLRTLMVAYRELDKAYFQTWIKKHGEAWLTLENRERKLALVYEEIERDLMAYALEGSLEFELLRTACMCKGVVCCRMTPLQKAQVVDLVKRYKKVVTLAIGDGANDISMIKAAHIGVGISNQEGMQATLSSDFSFCQFHFLQRLLLVHGRLSYNRMCKFLSYFFYKNFAFTLVHFWYAFFNGFSAQTVYDIWFITFYNLIYTSLPVLGLSLFEKDVNETWSLCYPELYEPGQHNLYFNKKEFVKCLLHGIYNSFVLFFVPMGTVFNSERNDGKDISDFQSFSLLVQTTLIGVMTMQIALRTTSWTMINHTFTWGSLGLYFCILILLCSDGLCLRYPSIFNFLGVARNSLSQPQIWLCLILSTILCMIPLIGYNFLRPLLWPINADKVLNRIHFCLKHPIPTQVQTKIKHPSLRRSAYAFSHKQGFGALITSGKTLKSSALAKSKRFL